MAEKIDAAIRATTGAGQVEGETAEGRKAEIFIVGADVDRTSGREVRGLGVGKEGLQRIVAW